MNKAFMHLAIDIATKNVENGGGPFGAVIVKDNEIISQSFNTVTTSNDPTAHAEINAIRKACKAMETFDLSGCEIYSSCEPCPMCLSAIYWARIEKIYFAADRYDAANVGFNDSFIYNELSIPISERKIPIENLMKEEGQEPFELWRKSTIRIEY